MAILKVKPKTGGSNRSWNLSDEKAIEGTFPGILLDILDNDGVMVRDFNNPGEMLERDVTRFLFAFTDDDGDTCLSMTGEMTQSADERSNLVKLLTAIRGKLPPLGEEYDYCDEIGKKVMVTIGTRKSKLGKEYSFVQSVAKINKKLEDDVPSINTAVPGDRRSPIPDWISEEDEEPVKMDKPTKKKATKKKQDDDEEDPF